MHNITDCTAPQQLCVHQHSSITLGFLSCLAWIASLWSIRVKQRAVQSAADPCLARPSSESSFPDASCSFEQFPRSRCLSSNFPTADESPSSRNWIAVSQTIGGRLRTCGRARAACAASTFYCAAPETLRQQRAQLRNTVRPGYV